MKDRIFKKAVNPPRRSWQRRSGLVLFYLAVISLLGLSCLGGYRPHPQEETIKVDTAAELPDGNQLLYLKTPLVYHPDSSFPKLTTPMWIGEDGVEAAIIVTIDDLRHVGKFDAFIRPIFDRIQKATGQRIPMSIMANQIDPQHPRLQDWIKEGLTFEVHTSNHLCPLLQRYDFDRAAQEVLFCLDNLFAIPGNIPLAFRMPCSDSQNSVTPRFFSEIFLQPTPQNNLLRIDSSIFCLLTPQDPEIPPSLVADSEGKSLHEKYLPSEDYVNYIENYPYPYIIHNTIWEFPVMIPSDWQGIVQTDPVQLLEDWKKTLDAVVAKKGVFVLCTHPKGPKAQIADFIEYASAQHGQKVKFLSFKDAYRRLLMNLQGGMPLWSLHNKDHGFRLVDLDADGYLDVIVANPYKKETRIWNPDSMTWSMTSFPQPMVDEVGHPTGVKFVRVRKTGYVSLLLKNKKTWAFHDFNGTSWGPSLPFESLLPEEARSVFTSWEARHRSLHVLDANGDRFSDLVFNNETSNLVFFWRPERARWILSSAKLPKTGLFTDERGHDRGHRFVHLNDDGFLDSVCSNEEEYIVALYQGEEKGWSEPIHWGRRSESLPDAVPPITENGVLMGAWFRGGSLYIQNERTGSRSTSSMRYDFPFLKSQR